MSKKRILYIEDNPQNKRLVRKLLTVKGYDVLEADDGLIGVEIAHREHPDLILMDINIPGIDGMEATARLKKSEVAHIPIIALTANAMVGDRERIMAAGCDEYMQKPVSNAVLWNTVERFIGKGDTPTRPIPASTAFVRPAPVPATTISPCTTVPGATTNLAIVVTSMPSQSFAVPVNVLVAERLPDSPVQLTAVQPDQATMPSA
ncbi:MAG: response regulator [Aggregatilineales bacterium]